jgi:hypothetical protein
MKYTQILVISILLLTACSVSAPNLFVYEPVNNSTAKPLRNNYKSSHDRSSHQAAAAWEDGAKRALNVFYSINLRGDNR